MTYRADSSQTNLSVLVDTVTTPATADVQAIKVLDARANSGNLWNIETDGAARVVSDAVATATLTNLGSLTSVQTLVASNTSRRGLYIFNDSTANLYVKYGSAATTSSFTVKLSAGDFWEMPTRPVYNGIVTGIWDAANGNARITEM